MAFFEQAITVLQTLVIALGAGLGIWGVINLLEGYGNDNPCLLYTSLLKEIKARITRLYRWSKAETEKPQTQQSSLTALWEAQQQLDAPRTRTGKIRALQESAALFSFLQANGIQSMQQLHEKIADMNSCYYDLRGKIVKAERRKADGHACHEIHAGGFESKMCIRDSGRTVRSQSCCK